MDLVTLDLLSLLLRVYFYKEDMLDEGIGAKKGSFSAEELEDDELKMEDCRPVRLIMQ